MEEIGLTAGQGTLAQRIVAAPCLGVTAPAQTRVPDWLAELAATPAGTRLGQFVADHPMLATLLAGLAEGSP